ncbi:hypothetical protein Bbelb_090900 [Branchiostoma belcheri]|nr:hypothetical protein Bbelb_090900 [Branchiostoma belcheri]
MKSPIQVEVPGRLDPRLLIAAVLKRHHLGVFEAGYPAEIVAGNTAGLPTMDGVSGELVTEQLIPEFAASVGGFVAALGPPTRAGTGGSLPGVTADLIPGSNRIRAAPSSTVGKWTQSVWERLRGNFGYM